MTLPQHVIDRPGDYADLLLAVARAGDELLTTAGNDVDLEASPATDESLYWLEHEMDALRAAPEAPRLVVTEERAREYETSIVEANEEDTDALVRPEYRITPEARRRPAMPSDVTVDNVNWCQRCHDTMRLVETKAKPVYDGQGTAAKMWFIEDIYECISCKAQEHVHRIDHRGVRWQEASNAK